MTNTFNDRFWWCKPDKIRKPEPIKAKEKGRRLVRLPNGLKLPLTWYKPPTFASHGRMTANEVKAMDRAYRDWQIAREREMALAA